MSSTRVRSLWFSCAVSVIALGLAAGDAAHGQSGNGKPGYAYATNGVSDNIPGGRGSKWKLLVDASNLGGKELEAAEVTLPAGTTVPSHTHGSVEVIYVLAGVYGHEVNGRLYLLKPGMIGIVRPGDKVRHLVPRGSEAKLLILWTPAGEAEHVLAPAKGTVPAPVPEAASLDPGVSP